MIQLKRIYEPFDKNDGYRVLVDRLWPRGISKERAQLDIWLKEIAPSTKLRKWFSHDPEKWIEFKQKYQKELENTTEPKEALLQIYKKYSKICLLYAAKDELHNEAVALKEMLQGE